MQLPGLLLKDPLAFVAFGTVTNFPGPLPSNFDHSTNPTPQSSSPNPPGSSYNRRSSLR